MATNNATQADTSIFGRFFVRFTDEFYLVFRLIFAFIVALHGAQKAFLMWGFPANHPLGARVDIAGWVEFISALLIASGIFTRLGAGALCVTMVVAYFTVHSGGVAPHIFPNPAGDMGSAFGAHGGEIPILWFAIAGIIGVLGSRKYGLERLILKKEIL
jgi:uncharacterized membrane protein YphA (DoxX/SURF4 family)